MVIRTEYRGTRYSMGSSDPLPAGFEIRFGGLNFQATGNDYLMRLTNREELRARRQAGSATVAATPTPASTDAYFTINKVGTGNIFPLERYLKSSMLAPSCDLP
jgi:hypothetical protein